MKSKILKRVLGVVIAFGVVIGGGVYIYTHQSTDYADTYEQAMAERADIVNELKFSGAIEPNDSRPVYYIVSGKVVDVAVKEGDYVEAGDALVKLDSTSIEFDIQSKELALAQTQIDQEYAIKESKQNVDNLEQSISTSLNGDVLLAQQAVFTAQDAYQNAARDYNVALTQYQNETTPEIVAAKQTLKSAENEHSIAKHYDDSTEKSRQGINVTNAKENLELAKKNAKLEVEKLEQAMMDAEASMMDAKNKYDGILLEIEQNKTKLNDALSKQGASLAVEQSAVELEHLKRQLEDYTITAPISGYVTDIEVKVGDNLGESKALMVVRNYDTMKVKCKVDEYNLMSIKEGQAVEVYVNSLDQTYEGCISQIASTATADYGFSYVMVTIDFAPGEKISSGLGAQIRVVKDIEENALCVPVEAVGFDKATFDSYVQVMENGELVHRAVETGLSDDANIAILSGLEEGEVVYYE